MTTIININESTLSDDIICSIDSINFNLLSSEDIQKLCFAEINESKLTGEGRVYYHRLGEIRNYKKCITCEKTNQDCLGHFGHINLPILILHSIYLDDIIFCSITINCIFYLIYIIMYSISFNSIYSIKITFI